MAWIAEGTEWSDGYYNYIAYAKSDGTLVVRDAEGFDYALDYWLAQLDGWFSLDMVIVDDIEATERIARWESEVGVLPR